MGHTCVPAGSEGTGVMLMDSDLGAYQLIFLLNHEVSMNIKFALV